MSIDLDLENKCIRIDGVFYRLISEDIDLNSAEQAKFVSDWNKAVINKMEQEHFKPKQ